VLVGLGLASGIAGAALVSCTDTAQYLAAYQLGSGLLNQCFVVLPVLGVSPFFIERLLDRPTADEISVSQWRRGAVIAAATGVLFIGSFVLDVVNLSGLATWIRVAAVSVYLLSQLSRAGSSTLANFLRGGLITMVIGLVMAAALPLYRVAALHIVFITGFNLIVFTVAVRVIFGHSGELERLKHRLWFFYLTTTLLFVAMISRVSADFLPAVRTPHLISAAACWLAAVLVWSVKVLPKIMVVEPE
jgi:hypothetical protein